MTETKTQARAREEILSIFRNSSHYEIFRDYELLQKDIFIRVPRQGKYFLGCIEESRVSIRYNNRLEHNLHCDKLAQFCFNNNIPLREVAENADIESLKLHVRTVTKIVKRLTSQQT